MKCKRDDLSDYNYPSVGVALRRYHELCLNRRAAGSHPLSPDDCIKGTRLSGDSANEIEYLDLEKCMSCLTYEERWALYVEYLGSTFEVEGPRYGENKLEALRLLFGMRVSGDRYVQLVRDGTDRVKQELEAVGWIPSKTSRSSIRTFSTRRTKSSSTCA